MTSPGCTECGWVDRRAEASNQRSGATCPIKVALKQVPTAKCWSAQAASDRRITFNESLLCSRWPDGGTWSRWDEGGCSVWNFLPTQNEAAAARPSIYSRLIAEVHVTFRISQVVASVILRCKTPYFRNTGINDSLSYASAMNRPQSLNI